MIRKIATGAVVLCLMPSLLFAQTTPSVPGPHFTISIMSADVHKSPSLGSAIVGRAPRGRTLEVVRELGDWVKVTWPETQEGFGYLHVSMGRLIRGGVGGQVDAGGAGATRPGSQSTWISPQNQHVDHVVTSPASNRTVYVAPPTHFVGIGGRMSGSTLGIGVTGRVWSRGSLGGQIDVSRIAQTSPVTADRVTSVQFSPSVLYGFADFVTDYVWLRPYVGAGTSLHRHTMSGITPETSVSESTFSFQSFGGAEVTLASVPRFALSIDAGYDWAKTPFAGYKVGGLGFSVSGRWYFK